MNNNKTPIDFYYDLTSPYSYVAAELIEDIARAGGRTVNYLPTLLGFVFKATGNSAPMMNPTKGQYALKDFLRTARYHGLEMKFPKQFPINSTCATRTLLKVKDLNPDRIGPLTRALYKAFFVDGHEILTEEGVAAVANSIGLNGAELVKANQDEVYKEKSRQVVQQSIDAGMFGAPFFVVDGEAFWGQDRMEQLKRWVVDGPY